MVNCICQHCNLNFTIRAADLKRGGGKYCSRQCAGLSKVVKSIIRTCKCGISFAVKPTCKSRVTCSEKCAKTRNLSQLSRDKIAAALGQERIDGKYACICTFCGMRFMSVRRTQKRCDQHSGLHLNRAKKWDRAIAKLTSAFDAAIKGS